MRSNPLEAAFLWNRWMILGVLGTLLGLPACDDGIESPSFADGVGQVWVYSTRTQGVVSAHYQSLRGKTLAACPPSVAVSDSCIFSSCQYAPAALPDPVSAGLIGVSGLDGTVLLDPLAEPLDRSFYAPEEREEALFDGGETIRFEVAGLGEVPAASTSLVAPKFIDLKAPLLPEPPEEEEGDEDGEESAPAPTVLVDRTQELDISWTPIAPVASGELPVTATLSARKLAGDEVIEYQYSCRVDGALGGMTLSPDALKRLPPSSELEAGAALYIGRDAVGRVYGSWEHRFAVSALDIFPVTIE